MEIELARQASRWSSPCISVVVPAWNEVGNIEPLYRGVCECLKELDVTWELIFVDDGSQDGTWEAIRALRGRDERVKGLRLSRNFGHQTALLAGLSHAAGAAVISMDSDLQHPPELIPTLIQEWRRGNQIVHTVRKDSKGISVLKRVTSRAFYRVFSTLSGVHLEAGMADFRLLDQRVVVNLLRYREDRLFLRGVVQLIGFPSSVVSYEPRMRHSGETKYTYRRMLTFAWSAVSSFSLIPLRLAILLGLITSCGAFGMLVYAVYTKLTGAAELPGWASAVSIISFLFGILFVLLGIVGEYIGKILAEVKRRPRFLVQQSLGLSERGGKSRKRRTDLGRNGREPGPASRDSLVVLAIPE